METIAVVLKQPEQIELSRLALDPADRGRRRRRCRMERRISTGTERLLWSGRMPPFPGMGYPLVPGYESVGTRCRSRIGHRAPCRAAGLRSRREMFRRSARPVRRIGLAPGGAGEARGAARSEPRRSRHSAGAGGDGLSRDRRARRRRAGLHRRPRRARPAAGADFDRGPKRAAGGVGEKPGARRRRDRLRRARSRA